MKNANVESTEIHPIPFKPFSFLGILVGVALAFIGQSNLTWGATNEPNNQGLIAQGSLLLCIGGLIMAITTPSHVLSNQNIFQNLSSKPDDRPNEKRSYLLPFVPLAVCLGISSLGSFIYNLQGESNLVRGIWLLSVLGLILTSLLQNRSKISSPNVESSPPFHFVHWLILIVLIIGGCWLRFNSIDTLPADLHGDMASMGLGARDILSGAQNNFFGAGWAGIQLMAYQYEAIFMRLFGNNLFGLNTSAVFSGVLIIPGTYFLVWRSSDSHRLAILATLFLTINVSAIHFSRLAAYMDPWLFGVWSMFFFIDGLRARRASSFILAGIGTAFCIEMYFSGRSIPFMMLAMLLYALIFHRKWITQNIPGLTLMVLSAIITLGPALVYILRNVDVFMARSREVFLFTDGVMAHTLNKFNQTTLVGVLQEQIKRGLLMFNYYGDSSTQFGWYWPMFQDEIAVFIALGLFVSIFRPKRPIHAIAIIWWLAILFIGVILTVDPPFWPRLQGMPIAGAILAAIGLNPVLKLIESILERFFNRLAINFPLDSVKNHLASVIVFSALFAYSIYLGNQSWHKYYEFASTNLGPFAAAGRAIAQTPESTTACLFTDPLNASIREITFLGYPRKLINIPPNGSANNLGNCTGDSIVWIVSSNHQDLIKSIKEIWPNGVLTEFKSRQGTVMVSSYATR